MVRNPLGPELTVSMVGSPVKGSWKSAPSSVIVVNLFSETSWKPPLSYKTESDFSGVRRMNYRQQISVPSLEFVRSADLAEDLDPGAEVQVIGVIEDQGDSK